MFTKDDINLFADASHDKNPLHCDYLYARKTPYGEQVVHGILGVMASFEKLFQEKSSITITSIEITFLKPIFINVYYNVVINKISDTFANINIFDGETKHLMLYVEFDNSIELRTLDPPLHNDIFIKNNCAVNYGENIKENTIISGEYHTEKMQKFVLLNKFNLACQEFENISDLLLWSSYFIGMEMPGQQALYSKIELKIDKKINASMPLQYTVENKKFDTRFNLLYMEFECYISNNRIAHGKLNAFVRQKIAYRTKIKDVILSCNKEKLHGKTALITGASRGLGAMLARIFSAMSCHVIVNFQYSLDDAIDLQKKIEEDGGTIELWQGDISDYDWLKAKREELRKQGRDLDILVCNAFQPSKVLPFELASMPRICSYINKNIEMTCVPLATFMPVINKVNGYAIIISSEYVVNPIKEFPQYVGAKSAIEGLIFSLAISYRNLHWFIVRPPKMLTDMSNSPFGNYDLADPILIAKNICEEIFNSKETSNGVNIIEPRI
jgi:short-subunit dehydrogenase